MLKKIIATISIILSLNAYTQYDEGSQNSITEANVANEQNPWLLLDTTIAKLAEINYSNPIAARELINKDLSPLFDFEHISNHVLSVLSYKFTNEQIDYIADLIRSDVENALFIQLINTNIFGINITSVNPITHNYLEISMRIKTNSYFPITLKLVIYNNDIDWRIVNVEINNSNLVRYYQQVVLSRVSRYGVAAIFK